MMKLIYGGTEYDFTIDASSGAVIEWETETVRQIRSSEGRGCIPGNNHVQKKDSVTAWREALSFFLSYQFFDIIIHILFHAVKNKYNNDSEKLNDRYSKK